MSNKKLLFRIACRICQQKPGLPAYQRSQKTASLTAAYYRYAYHLTAGIHRRITEAVQHDCIIAFVFRTHSHFDNLRCSKRSIQSRIYFNMIFNKALHVQLHIRTYMHTEQMTACCHLLRSNPKVRINYKYFHSYILIPKQKQGTSSRVPFSDG